MLGRLPHGRCTQIFRRQGSAEPPRATLPPWARGLTLLMKSVPSPGECALSHELFYIRSLVALKITENSSKGDAFTILVRYRGDTDQLSPPGFSSLLVSNDTKFIGL
jgi:hypothetical protein